MGRFNRSTCAVVAAITLACGGKTEVLDESDIGGSAASGGVGSSGASGTASASGAAGRGGTLGGGSAGRGGAGAAGIGGAAGGSGSTGRGGSAAIPGVGGSAGIAGGGGATTGGAGGVAGGSTRETIDAICTHLERSGCAPPNCRERRQTDVDTYSLWGCGEARLESGACLLRDPTPCAVPSDFCVDALARAQKCIDDAEICVRGNTPGGGCVMGCEQGWAVECKPGPSGLICICTSGRRSGFEFITTVACQSEEWLKTIRSTCQ